MRARAVYLVFLLSGISGLVYQVIWVRWFGRLFGNTVYSASLVVAAFMCGLGLGSYLAGRWIDRRAAGDSIAGLRAYAFAELGIGILGALIALLLPALEPLSAHISWYTEGAHGWFEVSSTSYLLRYIIAFTIMGPITMLMGATLTVLIRYLVSRNIELAGWRIGFLYGFNTAGAALGAFLSDFALIPTFGLLSTQLFAVLLNLTAALLAFRLAAVPAGAPSRRPRDEAGALAADSSTAAVWLTCLAVFLTGFFAMGVEILWYRHFSTTLGGFRSVFSLLLTVVLIGMWLGSLAGAYAHRRIGRPALLFMVTQAALVTTTLMLLASVHGHRSLTVLDAGSSSASLFARLEAAWGLLKPMVLIAGLPSLLMGFAYPLANANIQRAVARIGGRAGVLYLANTLGAVLGSLIAGFFFLPRLGMEGSGRALAVFGLLGVVALYLADRRPGRSRTARLRARFLFATCLAAVLASVLLWHRTAAEQFARIGAFRNETVLAMSEGINEVVSVVECESCYEGRKLRTNGHNMSGTGTLAQRYMRAFAHVPLLHLEAPTDVLVICFGVGVTAHAASLHPTVERLEIADLSRNVLEHAGYFADANHGVLHDPRVSVFINDGRQHLWMRDEGTYDLITLEPPPIALAGVASLYSREFYELARSRLRDGGFMTQWLPAYQRPSWVVRSMVRAFLDAFPNAVLLSGERRELILMGSKSPTLTIDPGELQTRIDADPALAADLRRVHLGSATEILGMFVSASGMLRKATEDTVPITDDNPIMEYAGSVGACGYATFPRDMIDVSGFTSWCPHCVVGDGFAPVVADLGEYMLVMGRYFRSEAFLTSTNCPGKTRSRSLPLPPESAVFERYPYLEQIFWLR